MVQQLSKFLFGYDVFISYAYRDGKPYATALARQLTNLDLACYLDTTELSYGQQLTPTLERGIRRSRVLILVGTTGTVTAPYVQQEVKAAMSLGRPVIPVDVHAIRKQGGWPALAGVPWVEEAVPSAAEPSAAVLERIRSHFAYTRRNTIARRLVGTAAAILLASTVVAVFQWWQADAARVRGLARQLATQSELVRNISPVSAPVSALLAAESLRRFPSAEGEEALRRALSLLPRPPVHRTPLANVSEAQISPRGHLIAFITGERRLHVRRIGADTDAFPVPAEPVALVTFSGDETRLLVSQSRGIHLWDLDQGRPVGPPAPLNDDEPRLARVSLDGSRAVLVMDRLDEKTFQQVALVRVIDSATGKTVREITQPSVVAASLSADGAQVLLVGASRYTTSIRLLDVATGRALATKEMEGAAALVDFDPQGLTIVMTLPLFHMDGVSRKQIAQVISVDFMAIGEWTVREPVVLAHDADITGPRVSASGTAIVVTCNNQSVRVWSPSGVPIGGVRHTSPILQTAVGAEAAALAIADQAGYVQIYETASGRLVQNIPASKVGALAFQSDNRLLTIAREDGALTYWATADTTVLTEEGDDHPVQFGPGERVVLYMGDDTNPDRVGLWRIGTAGDIVELKGKGDGKAIFHSDGQHLFTVSNHAVGGGSATGERREDPIRIWDSATGQLVGERPREVGSSYAFSPDGEWLALTKGETGIEVTAALSGGGRRSLTASARIISIEFPDPETITVRIEGRKLQLFDLNTPETVRTFEDRERGFVDLAKDAGYAVVSGGSFSWISGFEHALIDLRTEKPIPLSNPPIGPLLLLPDHRRAIIAAFSSTSASLVDIARNRTIRTFEHGSPIIDIAITRDRKYAATAGEDGYAKVWDVERGQLLTRIAHQRRLFSLEFSPNGRYLLSHQKDDLRQLWSWKFEDTLAEARRRVGRNLSREEWALYLPEEKYCKTFDDLPEPTKPGG